MVLRYVFTVAPTNMGFLLSDLYIYVLSHKLGTISCKNKNIYSFENLELRIFKYLFGKYFKHSGMFLKNILLSDVLLS